ncbi:hypothetical protein BN1723_000721, partial [Verticillium longisporum]
MDFIGLQMLVTVKDPPGVRVKGTVSEVTPGQSLVLSNVFHLGSSKWIPRLTLEPNNIVDLAEYKDEVTPETFTAPGASSVPAPVLSQPALPSFTDPAIVSLGRRPGSGSQTPVESRPQSRSQPRPQSRRQSPPMVELERPPTQPGGLSIPSIGHVQRRESTKANLATEHEDLRIHNESHRQDLNDYTTPGTADAPLQAPKKRNRRARPNK